MFFYINPWTFFGKFSRVLLTTKTGAYRYTNSVCDCVFTCACELNVVYLGSNPSKNSRKYNIHFLYNFLLNFQHFFLINYFFSSIFFRLHFLRFFHFSYFFIIDKRTNRYSRKKFVDAERSTVKSTRKRKKSQCLSTLRHM